MEKERKKLNIIDDSIRLLFIQRMALVKDIAAHKKENHIAIEDTQREKQMVERLALDDPKLNVYYQRFLKSVIDISKDYQEALIKEDL